MVKRVTPGMQFARYAILCLVLGTMLFPFGWMVRVSLMEPGSLSEIGLFSGSFTLSNFTELFQQTNMGRYFLNSILVGVAVTLGNLLFCFMVAYTLARYQTLPNKILFFTVIVILMIPAHITIIPLYLSGRQGENVRQLLGAHSSLAGQPDRYFPREAVH